MVQMMYLYADVSNFMLFRLKTVGLRLSDWFRDNLTLFPRAAFGIEERKHLRRFMFELLEGRLGDSVEQGASMSFGAYTLRVGVDCGEGRISGK
jgi:hypothetical protein